MKRESNKNNHFFMNRIRKHYKPFLDQKRVNLRTSSMARRRAILSLNKVGEAYGVVVNKNGGVSRRPIGTASVKRRKLKYKISSNDKKEIDLKEIFKSNRFITTSNPKESSYSTSKNILKSSSQPNLRSVYTIPSNLKSTRKIKINSKLNVETT
jgi:tRNA(Ile)-lysidine synthase TilS/MesJ